MQTLYTQNNTSENISIVDKIVWFSLGMALIIAGMSFANSERVDWVYEILLGLVISLTGIAGWDPLYTLYNRIKANMSVQTRSRRAANAA